MKKKKFFIILFIVIILLNPSMCLCSTNESINLSCNAAILIDSKTNKVLFGKNENEKIYPASLTKIMTAIITLENCKLTDKVSASYNAISVIPEGYSIADIKVDEELTVEQLLQVLLLYSANDAANVLAEHVGGSIDSFVSMMNTKAHELNLQNTHFTNAFGMHDENHYSTAYDLSILMKYCMKDETFRKIAGSASCAIPATNKSEPRLYVSTNSLIVPDNKYYYKYATIGKTGFTTQAKSCLIVSAYKDNLELIGVILGANDSETRFSEAKQLFEYGFNNYSIQNIFNQGDVATNITISNGSKDTRSLDLIVSDNISALLNNNISISNLTPEINLNSTLCAPITEGDVVR